MQATKGFTFNDSSGAGNTCSAANLHSMVDSATFSGMGIGDFSSTERPVYVSGTAPSNPIDGQPWLSLDYSNTASNIPLLRIWTSSKWVPATRGTSDFTISGSCTTGDALVLSSTTDDTVSRGDTGGDHFIGLAIAPASNGETVHIITNGVASARANTVANLFQYVRISSAGAIAQVGSTTQVTTGVFGRDIGEGSASVGRITVYLSGILQED